MKNGSLKPTSKKKKKVKLVRKVPKKNVVEKKKKTKIVKKAPKKESVQTKVDSQKVKTSRIKKEKKIKENNIKKNLNKRMIALFGALSFILLCLIIRIGYLQFYKGSEYKQEAYNQQTINQIISPNRGNIFDKNGELLAQSVSVDTVSINPGKVKYSNGKAVEPEVLAKAFSEIFSLDYEETLSKTSSKSSFVTIAKKVNTETIDKLKSWMSENRVTTGINIDEDSKRYYPYGSLASQVIGFCSDDNQGSEGIERKWDDVLTGTSGKIVATANVKQELISDESELYVSAENGSNLYLTLDTTIQSIAEKYLEQAVKENQCTRGGNVIVMNPSEGDILAMATYPTYNLNEPFNPIATSVSDVWDSLQTNEKTAALQAVWRNKAVSDTYEPGSTFKLITSAIALEEDLVDTDIKNDFLCTGSHKVADYDIKCWRNYDPHGYQTLRDSLENSCNPAFIQLGQRIGVNRFYKYLDAFGLFAKTDAGFSGEASSIFYDEEDVNSVELATMSFGQRFSITPLQLISAVSCIANDGVYVKPRIVKQIENTDTGAITTTEKEEVREVLSKSTTEKLKSMMESVVTDGTGKHASVSGYSVGGKSGTSEPPDTKVEDGYVASFVAVSPIENTQVVVLVILYDPKGESHQGGQTAGPVASQILSEVLPYLGITSANSEDDSSSEDLITVPNVKNKTVTEAKKVLEQLGFKVNVSVDGDANTLLVSNQVPKEGTRLGKNSIICLYSENNSATVSVAVPNIKGMSAAQATNALRAKNLNINIQGNKGIVVSQDPTYDSMVEEGTVINVVLKEQLVDGQ